ncbi:MAG: nucleoside 2-deoxyribosyltransferase [Armatimonadetes bacterium]|nr:nucleoside 2-deoxyribosyltransferase [Armatimonadota bacterium]
MSTESSGRRIYFCASIRGGRQLQPLYAKVVRHLEERGHRVLTRHVAEPAVLVNPLKHPTASSGGPADASDVSGGSEWEAARHVTPQETYARDMAWLRECDLVIAEVSVPSLGVGIEIATAQHLGKPIACLVREGTSLSAMVAGNPAVRVLTYREDAELIRLVDHVLVNSLKHPTASLGGPADARDVSGGSDTHTT